MKFQYTIKIKHYRIPDDIIGLYPAKGMPPSNSLFRYSRKIGWLCAPGTESIKPTTHGGLTRVTIRLATGEEFVGTAICSMADAFNYKKGVLIAYGRAHHAMMNAPL